MPGFSLKKIGEKVSIPSPAGIFQQPGLPVDIYAGGPTEATSGAAPIPTPPISSDQKSEFWQSRSSTTSVGIAYGSPTPLPTPPAEEGVGRSRFNLTEKVGVNRLMAGKVSPSADPGKPKESSPQAGSKMQLPPALRKVANLSNLEIEGSILSGDIRLTDSEKQEKKEGLCSACSKIDFEQFASKDVSIRGASAGRTSYKLIFLDRIIRKKKRGTCRFCELLFDAIAENDPFEHPAVKNHLPKELERTTFRQWADGLSRMQDIPLAKSAYPFGRSRDNVKVQHKVGSDGVVQVEDSTQEDDVTTSDAANIAGIGAASALGAGIWTETDKERIQIMATVGTVIPTITSLVSNLNSKLPVAVSIIIHNTGDVDAGLLNVDVWGYGNAHRAPLSRISTFNLRVASGYERVGPDLHYGSIIKEEIDVEGECREWLDACLAHHGDTCHRPGWGAELPPPSGEHFRLVDVHAMRVVQVSQGPGSLPPYAALSYVWGATGKLALNLHVRNSPQLNISLEGQSRFIARTIRDAIETTRRLGLPYLWVDSLCIVQQDESGEDDPSARGSQIAQMDSIYGHAQVTLVSADGTDAEAGLPGIGPGSRPAATQIARTVVPDVNVLLAVKYPGAYGKWDTRAWTLQEKLLSRRLLIFSGGSVSFHCRHGILREDMPARHAGNGPPQIPWLTLPERGSGASTPSIKQEWDGTPVILRASFFTEYASLVEQYSGRELTDSRDSLNAVFGLLRVLERMASGKPGVANSFAGLGNTLHGLPERFLDLALMWHPPATDGVYLTRKSHDNLPSWSWAGWEVGRDAEFSTVQHSATTKPGVRFEEPFWVAANDDLSLRKVISAAGEDESGSGLSIRKVLAQVRASEKPSGGAVSLGKAIAQVAGKAVVGSDTDPTAPSIRGEPWPLEERYKPLVMWYRASLSTSEGGNSRLIPVNGQGLGLGFDRADESVVANFVEAAIRIRGHNSPPMIPADLPIDSRHLVCETQITSFRLRRALPRKEKLWKRTSKGLVVEKELTMLEAEVLDRSGQVVGHVVPTDVRKGLSSELYHFILLAESQYWGNEVRVDVSGMPLYNVMVVEWDTRGEFASRVAVGKVQKSGWWNAEPKRKVVVLK